MPASRSCGPDRPHAATASGPRGTAGARAGCTGPLAVPSSLPLGDVSTVASPGKTARGPLHADRPPRPAPFSATPSRGGAGIVRMLPEAWCFVRGRPRGREGRRSRGSGAGRVSVRHVRSRWGVRGALAGRGSAGEAGRGRGPGAVPATGRTGTELVGRVPGHPTAREDRRSVRGPRAAPLPTGALVSDPGSGARRRRDVARGPGPGRRPGRCGADARDRKAARAARGRLCPRGTLRRGAMAPCGKGGRIGRGGRTAGVPSRLCGGRGSRRGSRGPRGAVRGVSDERREARDRRRDRDGR